MAYGYGDSYSNRGYDSENTNSSNSREDNEFKEKIKFILTIVSAAFIVIMAGILIFSSLYFTTESQQAVVTTFGNPKLVVGSGPHGKIPLVQSVTKVDMSGRGMSIGYTEDSDETVAEEVGMITKDFNFLDVYFYIEYQVSDPIKFLYNSEEPEVILSNLAQSAIRDTVGSYGVDDVLTTSRGAIEEKVKETLVASLEAADIGLKVNNATIQDVDTPTPEVQAAFDAVETAKQDAEKEENNAKAYAAEAVPNAEANADKLVKQAEADKTARINEANGQVSRFVSLYEEYKKAPEVTKLRMYYEVMEQVMPGVKVIITNDDGQIVNVFTQPNVAEKPAS